MNHPLANKTQQVAKFRVKCYLYELLISYLKLLKELIQKQLLTCALRLFKKNPTFPRKSSVDETR